MKPMRIGVEESWSFAALYACVFVSFAFLLFQKSSKQKLIERNNVLKQCKKASEQDDLIMEPPREKDRHRYRYRCSLIRISLLSALKLNPPF